MPDLRYAQNPPGAPVSEKRPDMPEYGIRTDIRPVPGNMANHFPLCLFVIFRKKIIAATILPSPHAKKLYANAVQRGKPEGEKVRQARNYDRGQSRRKGSAP